MVSSLLNNLFSCQRMFAPALPPDILVNFYINLNKLCLTIYQLHVLQPSTTKVMLAISSALFIYPLLTHHYEEITLLLCALL